MLGTDRDRVDTDDDGLDDGLELIYRPRDRVAEAPDDDGDGLPDALESATKDADGDGVPDQQDRCNDDPGCPGRRDELCNDLDDDDDGQVDEAFPDKGLPCTLGEGACAADGTVICSPDGKELWCDATPGEAAAEACNDLDDDCDGATDEDFPTLGEACSAGEGPCRVDGVLACDDTGAVACDAVARRAEGETCNGVDDDCDGTVDEGFPALGVPCSVGMGLCARDGVGVCAGAGVGVLCDARPGEPVDELCNGADDDCDGITDEGFELGAACAEGELRCRSGGVWICGADGARKCDRPAPATFDETCNGADDDCDGATDEGLLPYCRPVVDHTALGGRYVDLNVAGRPGELVRGHWGVNRVDANGLMRWTLDEAINDEVFFASTVAGDRVDISPGGRLDWYEEGPIPVWQGGVSSDGRMALATNTTNGAIPDLRMLVQPAGAFDAGSLRGAYHVAHLRVPRDAAAEVRFGQATADGVDTLTLTDARAYTVAGPAALGGLPRAGAYTIERTGDLRVGLAEAELAGALLDPGGVAFLSGDPRPNTPAGLTVLVPHAQAADKDTLRGAYWFVALRVDPADGRLTAVQGRFEAAAGELFFDPEAFQTVDGARGTVDWQPEIYSVAPDGFVAWRRAAGDPDARLGTGAVSPDGRVAVLTGFDDPTIGPSILVAIRVKAGLPSGIEPAERAFFQDRLAGGATDCVIADCAPTAVALGGGGFWEASQLDETPLIDLSASHNEDGFRWAQCGMNAPGADPQDWDSGALCAEVAVETTTRVAEGVYGGGAATMTAWCEPGEVVLGGGAIWGPGLDLTGLGPAERGEGWTLDIGGLLPGGRAFGSWRVEAICARGLPAPRRVVVDATLAGDMSDCAALECPPGTAVISGGTRYPAAVRPDHHQPSENGWFVCGYVRQAEEAVVEMTALCVPDPG